MLLTAVRQIMTEDAVALLIVAMLIMVYAQAALDHANRKLRRDMATIIYHVKEVVDLNVNLARELVETRHD